MERQQQFAENKRAFTDLLEFDSWHGKYGDKIRELIDREERRLYLILDDLQDFKPDLHRSILKNPGDVLPAFEQALKEAIETLKNGSDDSTQKKQNSDMVEYFIGIDGSFGSHHVSPRQLGASFIGNLVLIEGIVTKCSLVRPKVVKSVHFCTKTNEQHVRYYKDAISTSTLYLSSNGSGFGVGFPTSTSYPTKDANDNPLSSEYGLSIYKDHQTFTIQEMPEKAPAGQLPCSVDVVIEDDLVDRIKPGDRVQVCGIYKSLPQKSSGHTNGIFRTIVVANSIKHLSREIQGPVMTDVDIKNIKEMAANEKIFDLLSQSLAPSIFGHEYIKKAILLMMLGGIEKNLLNKTHLRGDINILLIGDPSTAKSQMLRFVLNTSPLAISTTGRSSSGPGLTAAVVYDHETGERRLEAGAMVLADRGVVCIDEFDKMNEDDRVAIHEVMEQQTVTIAKAGIHTTLNARCCVLAAANPIYGQYNRQKKPTENIALPDSLLSRFDLLFILLDNLSPEHDRAIADHVLRIHRFQSPIYRNGCNGPSMIAAYGNDRDANLEDVDDISVDSTVFEMEEDEETPIYQKIDKILHGNLRRKQELFSIPFVKKYILYARNRIKPVLSDEANVFISNSYATLRSKDSMRTLPITARTLETMIRLATAHAKCRLSEEVTEMDAQVALDIMNYALFHESGQPDHRETALGRKLSKTASAHGGILSPMNEGDDENFIEINGGSKRKRTRSIDDTQQASQKQAQLPQIEDSLVPGEEEEEENLLSPSRLEEFKAKLSDFFRDSHTDSSTVDEIEKFLNGNNTRNPFSRNEIGAYLKLLDQQGKVSFADNLVVLTI